MSVSLAAMQCFNPFDEQQQVDSDLYYQCDGCCLSLHAGNIVRCSSCETVECFECAAKVQCTLCREPIDEASGICRHCDDTVVCGECKKYLRCPIVEEICSECSELLRTRRKRCKFCSSETCCHSACVRSPIDSDNYGDCSDADEEGTFAKCYGCANIFCAEHMRNVCRKCHAASCESCALVIKQKPRTCGCRFGEHCAKPDFLFAAVLSDEEKEEHRWCRHTDYLCNTLICENCLEQNKVCFFEWNVDWHDRLVDIGMTLLSGGLPPYIVLQIFDLLPHTQYLPHVKKIALLAGLQQSINKLCARNVSDANTVKKPNK